jgi:hypothetical protein
MFASSTEENEQGERLGQGVKELNPDTDITVEYTGDIIPTSQAEELEKITKETLGGLRAMFSAMKEYHGWSDERAALEMDLIKAESRRSLVDNLGFKDLVDIVMERQALEMTTAEKAEAEEILFDAGGPMPADENTEDDEDEAEGDEDEKKDDEKDDDDKDDDDDDEK